jgi:hypothetical protein
MAIILQSEQAVFKTTIDKYLDYCALFEDFGIYLFSL